ncbi:hypothetical protein HPB52_019963 [Rhipicephalus sanguineus]|uniref:HTH psq-type domain-containing protein n=1 Tax=Rhipicephalus sanguineus TaxID=34632 RepID=A0A9D4QAL8_RHISA|nr:hypothetical protein HPB52_019963 [Rhipicephalus sanguineus]
MAPPVPALKCLTSEQKVQLVREVEKGGRQKSEIARQFGIPTSTLSTVLKNKDAVLDGFEKSFSAKRKRNHIPVVAPATDAEIVDLLGGPDEEEEPLDEQPREIPTVAQTQEILRLLRNRVECAGGDHDLIICPNKFEQALLAPSRSTRQSQLTDFCELNFETSLGWRRGNTSFARAKNLDDASSSSVLKSDESTSSPDSLMLITSSKSTVDALDSRETRRLLGTPTRDDDADTRAQQPETFCGERKLPRATCQHARGCASACLPFPVKLVDPPTHVTQPPLSRGTRGPARSPAARAYHVDGDTATAAPRALLLFVVRCVCIRTASLSVPAARQSQEMDDGNGKRKRKTITIEQKAAMLKAVESGVKKKKHYVDDIEQQRSSHRCRCTIANCFRHASFGVNSGGDSEDIGAAANEGAAGDQDLASWDALLDARVVPDCDTFCTYVSADADAVTTEELTEAEIVRAVTGVVNDDSDECVDDSPEFANPMFGAHDDGEDGLDIAAAAEKGIIRLRKTRQKSIKDFFFSK